MLFTSDFLQLLSPTLLPLRSLMNNKLGKRDMAGHLLRGDVELGCGDDLQWLVQRQLTKFIDLFWFLVSMSQDSCGPAMVSQHCRPDFWRSLAAQSRDDVTCHISWASARCLHTCLARHGRKDHGILKIGKCRFRNP